MSRFDRMAMKVIDVLTWITVLVLLLVAVLTAHR